MRMEPIKQGSLTLSATLPCPCKAVTQGSHHTMERRAEMCLLGPGSTVRKMVRGNCKQMLHHAVRPTSGWHPWLQQIENGRNGRGVLTTMLEQKGDSTSRLV